MEVAVSLDDRSSPEAHTICRELADVLIVRRHDYASAGINHLLAAATRPWAFWVSDDEEPGTDLWKVARKPQLPLSYRVLLLCPLSRTTHYARGGERQVRLFPRTSYRWEGDVNGDPILGAPVADLPDTVLWHYGHTAPIEERERKEVFQRDVVGDGTSYRYFPERHPEFVEPLDDIYRKQLPK